MFPVWELVFPKECVICHSKSALATSFLCEDCSSKMTYLEKPLYDKYSKESAENAFQFDYVQAVYPLSAQIRTLIHHFKYNEMTKIGSYLAGCANQFMGKNPFPETIDHVIPIPLHSVKKRMRGFNQAEILSKQIAAHWGISHTPNLVLRKKFTSTQTKLKKEERLKNVSDAFFLSGKYNVKNKVVLIVDDVFTTGSTANSISQILKKNDAKCVFVLTIAKA
jgi:ComF family protein